MKLENDKCKIEISVDHTYRIGSADNKPYDKIYYSKDQVFIGQKTAISFMENLK